MRAKVSKTELLRKVAENRNLHLKDFDETWIAYLAKAKKDLRKAAREVDKTEKGKAFKVPSTHPVPVSHEEDYDRIMGLLQFTDDDEIELNERDYEQYILDKWDWKEVFNHTSGYYKG